MTKNTTAIIFNGGAYGTYLEWVLTTLTTDIPINSSLNNNGNSHKFIGNHFGSVTDEKWKNFTTSDSNPAFVRLHPKTKQNASLLTNINQILDVAGRGIYLYPDHDSILLNINNYYSKIWKSWWEVQLTDPVFSDNLFNNWPISRETTVSEIPVWILRELLSLYIMPAWFDQVEWYHPDTWSHNRCQLVLLNELLYNFKNTILKIQKFCNLEFTKSIDDMIPYHNKMLSLQKWLTQDQLCNNIIDSIINNQAFNWSDQELPLPSQAWIQWQLKNLGYKIRCNGLDKFPNDSVQLGSLLYNL